MSRSSASTDRGVRNALNAAVARAIADAIDQAQSSDQIRVSVLTGDTDAFSSGTDLRALSDGETAEIDGRGLCGIADRRFYSGVACVPARDERSVADAMVGCERAREANAIVSPDARRVVGDQRRFGLRAAGG
jgi:hypothetical protein